MKALLREGVKNGKGIMGKRINRDSVNELETSKPGEDRLEDWKT
jgi:hypothetical protein